MTKRGPVFSEKMSAVTKELWSIPEYRAKHIEGMRQSAKIKGFDKILSKRSKEMWNDPTMREKIISGIKRKKQSPEFKIKMRKYFSSEEYKRQKSGSNSHMWKGGMSYEPYCYKFNHEFKERVREFFGRKCIVCGKTEQENNKKLDVHHINYDKQSCCNNTKPLFAPLCQSCHRRTSHFREYWRDILTNLIMLEYDGECFLQRGSILIESRSKSGIKKKSGERS